MYVSLLLGSCAELSIAALLSGLLICIVMSGSLAYLALAVCLDIKVSIVPDFYMFLSVGYMAPLQASLGRVTFAQLADELVC